VGGPRVRLVLVLRKGLAVSVTWAREAAVSESRFARMAVRESREEQAARAAQATRSAAAERRLVVDMGPPRVGVRRGMLGLLC
jgi:hypothetical protein